MLNSLISRARVTLLLVAFGLPVLAFAYGGRFARYEADDWCFATRFFERGFVGAQQFWYMSWFGRFTMVGLIDVLVWLGPWTVPLQPVVMLVAWVIANVLVIRPVLVVCGSRHPRAHALLLSLVLVSTTLGSAAGFYQALYWQSGSIPYLLPIILGTLYAYTVWKALAAARAGYSRQRWLAASALLAALVVGCSETAMILLGGSLGLVWLFLLAVHRSTDRRALLTTIGTGVAAAALAGLVVVASPGNSIREGMFVHPNAELVIGSAAWYPFLVLFTILVRAPVLVVLAYVMARIAGGSSTSAWNGISRASWARLRRAVFAVWIALAAVSAVPSLRIGGGVPPERAQFVPVFMLVVMFITCGFVDGLVSRPSRTAHGNRWVQAIGSIGLVAALVLGPLLLTVQTLSTRDERRAYARSLDEIDRQARAAGAAGQRELTVPAVKQPSEVKLEPIGSDPTAWPNICVAEFYALDKIAALSAAD